ncbi:MAG: dihydrofolate reductase family protein [Gammaproteobacteria bacterium]|nr:dihydrofolate reductase family protein [Gammaproteobacteria bacterium]
MIDVVYYVAASLDGYIAAVDGGVDWLNQFGNSNEDHGFSDLYSTVDGIVMGSHTYEFSLAQSQWPAPDKPSWVLTHRDLPVAHPSVTLTADEPSRLVRSLAERGLKSVWLMGGGKVAASFRHTGLISRYIIAVMPIILGTGIPLLAAVPGQDVLTLIEAKPYPSGIVQLHYESKLG